MNTLCLKSRILLAALTCATCALAAARPAGCGGAADGACLPAAESSAPITLGEPARAALRFQIGEERMARELYTAFGAQWGLRPFSHIPEAESRHEAALRALAARAGLAGPAAIPGKFATAEVQQRHDTLLARGRESAEAALRAAAFVEEQDIADLRALAATTDSPEMKQLVVALEQASGRHLAAFVRHLEARGLTYAPQVLAAGEFRALTGEGCGPGGGVRHRGGRRNGSG